MSSLTKRFLCPQLESERGSLEEKLRKVTEQWEDLRDQLNAEESTRAELEKERDTLRKAIEDKDNQIQVGGFVC
jgi:chromosome segregation ATPase